MKASLGGAQRAFAFEDRVLELDDVRRARRHVALALDAKHRQCELVAQRAVPSPIDGARQGGDLERAAAELGTRRLNAADSIVVSASPRHDRVVREVSSGSFTPQGPSASRTFSPKSGTATHSAKPPLAKGQWRIVLVSFTTAVPSRSITLICALALRQPR